MANATFRIWRGEGQPHPEGVLTLRVKAEREREVLRGALVAVGADTHG